MGSKDPLFRLPVFVSGPLTDLPAGDHDFARAFYVRIANACEEAFGIRSFVPHEEYDPHGGSTHTPKEIDAILRERISDKMTSMLVVVALSPSFGTGIEVEMAYHAGIPVVLLVRQGKRISRLLLGSPAILKIIEYAGDEDALYQLRLFFKAQVNAESF